MLDNSKSECPGYPGGRPRLVDELARGGLPGIEAIVQIHARLEAIRTILVSHLGESGVPEMEQLQKLTSIVALVRQSGETRAPQELQDPDVQAENAPAATTTAPRRG